MTVLHQVGQLAFGTFDFSVEHDFDTEPDPALVRLVFEALEDRRVDLALRRRYPGAIADLDRVLAHALAPPTGTGDVAAAGRAGRGHRAALARWAGARRPARRHLSASQHRDPPARRDAGRRVVDGGRQCSSAACHRRAHRRRGGDRVTVRPGHGDDHDRDHPGHRGQQPERDRRRQHRQRARRARPGHRRDRRSRHRPRRHAVGRRRSRERPLEGRAGTMPEQFIGSMDPTGPAPEADEDADRSARRRARGCRVASRRSRAIAVFLYDEWDHLQQDYLTAWCRLLRAPAPGRRPRVPRRCPPPPRRSGPPGAADLQLGAARVVAAGAQHERR